MKNILFWTSFELLVAVAAWFWIVRPALKKFQWSNYLLTQLDDATMPFWQRITPAYLRGLWTAVVASLMTLLGFIGQLIDGVAGQNVNWTSIFGDKGGNVVLVFLGIAIVILHQLEMKWAGNTAPPKE